ncbi:MAG: hypothetical protein COU31_04230 [Candidatus Magasanikbacteria bacterium CG10_big_fil_rev_8_21_14_0_10_40_10]|uniref:TIGR00374 family protein n=2 Tax=Parcubacteria group TaxID=1794811 RepID=A0A2M6W395_9BACT|nr:MAG: hypothetical protein COU31_04230 [Candidatus Magasanikbacteria bacterium CG10_big_fil_rev_8_21_14_0_10_40_10]
MKKVILFFLSLIVGVALFIAVFRYIGVEAFKEAFKSFSWWTIGVVAVLAYAQTFVGIYRWKLILRAQGDNVTIKQLVAPKFAGLTVSYLTPGPNVGGEPVSAYFLKRNAGIGYSKGFASILVDKILDFTYPIPFLIAAMVYAFFKYDISWQAIGVFVFTLLVLIVLLAVFYVQTYRGIGFFSSVIRVLRLHRFKRMQKMIDKMLHFEELIIKFFNHQKELFAKGLILSLIGGIIVLLQFVIVLISLGIEANIVQILMMMVFMILSSFMPIPAGLGSYEAGQVIVFSALGYTASIGVAFALILRAVEVFKLGLGLFFLSHVGIRVLQELPANGNGKKSTSDDPGEFDIIGDTDSET